MTEKDTGGQGKRLESHIGRVVKGWGNRQFSLRGAGKDYVKPPSSHSKLARWVAVPRADQLKPVTTHLCPCRIRINGRSRHPGIVHPTPRLVSTFAPFGSLVFTGEGSGSTTFLPSSQALGKRRGDPTWPVAPPPVPRLGVAQTKDLLLQSVGAPSNETLGYVHPRRHLTWRTNSRHTIPSEDSTVQSMLAPVEKPRDKDGPRKCGGKRQSLDAGPASLDLQRGLSASICSRLAEVAGWYS